MKELQKATILKIVSDKSGLGKTAMMKFIFILQEVFKIPLGYNYEIYTYGPYSSEVVEDIELVKYNKWLDIEVEEYKTGHIGYHINLTDSGKNEIQQMNELSTEHSQNIKSVLDLFGNKNVKELELSTTILYTYKSYKKNNWEISKKDIVNDVKEIKPHFEVPTIEQEYDALEKNQLLARI